MPFSDGGIKDIIEELVESTVNDAVSSSEGVWANLTSEKAADAKIALRRYSQNQLNAIRFPDNDEYLKGAAHNINTLQSLAASEVIQVRRESRAFISRVFDRILDAGFAVIDAAL